jgi:monofunctional biosynthetic peptidoglycan transglycosylase
MILRRRPLLRRILAIGLGVPLAMVLFYRFVPPPITPLMVIRLVQGQGLNKDWMPLSAISPDLQRAVMAGEDGKFCTHHGFDWSAIDNAMDVYEEGGHVLGASTISMQTAKNLFLWPGRDFIRKGVEAVFTVMLETLWPKRRIMEVYLNIIEWGPGIYGAEAASRHYFHKPAALLTHSEAAALAAVLPSPLKRSPVVPEGYVASYMHTISSRMSDVPMKDGRVCP